MTIKIQNASEIKNVQGMPRSKKAKPVICLDTGEVFASATDAANANNVTTDAISKNCLGRSKRSNGKKFCYVEDVTEHLEELTSNMQAMYDESIVRKEITPAPTSLVKPKPKAKKKSFGRKIIDMFAKRNIRTAI